MINPRLRRWLLWSLGLCLLVVLGVWVCNYWIVSRSDTRLLHDAKALPEKEVVLVLGTSPFQKQGKNPFFQARITAAAKLWAAGKAKHFLLSGDNGNKDYDEPSAMREALVKRGVPLEATTLDYAGFRTLDSMVRAKEVFVVDKVVIVTDDWHLPRALFLADAAGLQATGFCAESIPVEWSRSVRFREVFSRVKAVLDIHLLGTKPKFLGKREPLEVQ